MKHQKSNKSSNSNNHNSELNGTSDKSGSIFTSKPSHELFEYYKNKAQKAERDYNELSEIIDKVKSSCDLSAELQTELNLRNEEVSRLQQAVSDLQIHLFREREQSLRLSAENDKLRIQEFEDRKKIDALLTLSGTTNKELLQFISTNPNALVVPQKLPPKLQKLRAIRKNTLKALSDTSAKHSPNSISSLDPQALILQNQSLASQLEHHINISRDQIKALLKDREMAVEERQIEKARFQKEIDLLSAKLKKTQDNLCETTAKLIRCQQTYDKEKTEWMEEKDKYLKMIRTLTNKNEEIYPEVLGYSVNGIGNSKTRLCGESEIMKEQIMEKEHLAALYQEQVVALEAEVSRLKEKAETCRRVFKEKTEKMTAQVAYLKNKYEDLDRRRLLEAEGFRTDIKMLRERLKDLEKKLTKANVATTINPSEQQLLTSARNTLNRARLLEKELTNIKSKIASLESNGDS